MRHDCKCITLHLSKTLIARFVDNPEVYKWVPPTHTYRGNESQVKTPTDVTYRNQINNKRIMIENQCNMVWENICQRRNVPSKFRDLFLNHNTTLPTLYTLIKTHKIPPDSNLNDLKSETNRIMFGLSYGKKLAFSHPVL